MQTHPDDDEAYLASRTGTLRSQGRIPHKGKLVLDKSTQPANEAYQLFGIEVPTSVMLQDGKLVIDPPAMVLHLFRPPEGRAERGKFTARNGREICSNAKICI